MGWQKQRRKFLPSTSISSPKGHYLWSIHSTIQNTQHHHKECCCVFPINFYCYLLVTFTSGKSSMMIIPTKRKSSIGNKLFMLSYMFGKYFCTISAKVLKLHKAKTHNSSWGGAFAYAMSGGNRRHMVFEVWRFYFNSIICKYKFKFYLYHSTPNTVKFFVLSQLWNLLRVFNFASNLICG